MYIYVYLYLYTYVMRAKLGRTGLQFSAQYQVNHPGVGRTHHAVRHNSLNFDWLLVRVNLTS